MEVIDETTNLVETVDSVLVSDNKGPVYSSDLFEALKYSDDDDESMLVFIQVDEESSSLENTNRIKKQRISKIKCKRKKKKQINDGIKNTPDVVCHLCGKLVKNLKVHMTRHGENTATFPCSECSKVFRAPAARQRHVAIHHLGREYYCEICDRSFKSSEHTRLNHNKVKIHECVLCRKKFHSPSKLRLHMASHTKLRPFPCSVCGEGFLSKAHADLHRRHVHNKEKNYICQICSRGFFYLSLLERHLRCHARERNFQCTVCDKRLASQQGLDIHMLRHTGIKNVVCELCDTKFFALGDLKAHMTKHTKQKNYSCKYCDTKFLRSDHRNRHEKNSHGNVAPPR